MAIRPRRSVLYMPGSNARALEKAKTLAADALILDLEDAVAPDAKETRARIVPGRAPMLPWLSACVLAAHAYGIDVLDGVYNDIANTEGFAAECAQGRDMGFDGKTLIHPKTIATANRIFAPSPDDLASARRIIAAHAEATAQGKGVVVVDGRMIENLHVEQAQRQLALAKAIAELDS